MSAVRSWHEKVFWVTSYLATTAPKCSPTILSLYFVGPGNPAKFPPNIPQNFSAKIQKHLFHRRASTGEQWKNNNKNFSTTHKKVAKPMGFKIASSGDGQTRNLVADWNLSSAELESGNTIGAFLQTTAPVLDKICGPMGARFLSSTGLGSGNHTGWAQFPPAPALDKNRSPILVHQEFWYPFGWFFGTHNPCPIWLEDRGTGQWKWMEEVPRRTSLAPFAFPCFVLYLIGVEAWRACRLPGGGRGSFPLYGGTFARSYSVSKEHKCSGNLRVLSATFILSKYSRVLDAKSRLKSRLKSAKNRPKVDPNSTKNRLKLSYDRLLGGSSFHT